MHTLFLTFLLALFVSLFTFIQPASAQLTSQEFKSSQLSFDYMASDGSYWHDCTHEKGRETHAWVVLCQDYKFNLHLLLYQYIRPNEATFELHYWADEMNILKQSHTQSTWLTVDKEAKTKKITAYLGFSNDASQLRMQIDMKK